MIRVADLVWLITVCGVLASVAVAAAQVTWHVSGHSSVLPVSTDISPAVEMETTPANLGPLLALGPFGEIIVPETETGPVGETSLSLVLRGIVMQQNERASSALISNGNTTQSYLPGDEVTDAASLVSVAATQVVLDVDGELQTLSFPDPNEVSDSQNGVGTSGVDRLRQAIGSQSGAAPTVAEPETTDDYINLWRNRITANPAEVLDAIGLIPSDNGYIIADQHDSGVRQAGLRAGDVVTTVNGQSVGNVEDDRQLYDEVAESGLARIEVIREGRTIVMSFPLQ